VITPMVAKLEAAQKLADETLQLAGQP